MNINDMMRFRTALRFIANRKTNPHDLFSYITGSNAHYTRAVNTKPMTSVESHLRSWWAVYFLGLSRTEATKMLGIGCGPARRAAETGGWLGIESDVHDNTTTFQEYMELGIRTVIDDPSIELRFPKFSLIPDPAEIELKKCNRCQITKTASEFYINRDKFRRTTCKCCEAQEQMLCADMVL